MGHKLFMNTRAPIVVPSLQLISLQIERPLTLVRLATFILQPKEQTNHKFPAAMATGVPSEVKSTVRSGHYSPGPSCS